MLACASASVSPSSIYASACHHLLGVTTWVGAELCRYYDGALLLARAVRNSIAQLFVPLFMLMIMIVCFANIMFELEWDHSVQACSEHWVEYGIGHSFLRARPEGVTWGCAICDQLLNASTLTCRTGIDDEACYEQQQLCATCRGHPPGHGECLGRRFEQRFPDVPRSMWYIWVTVSTVGYGDLAPSTQSGQLFGVLVIVCGVIFLAMVWACAWHTRAAAHAFVLDPIRSARLHSNALAALSTHVLPHRIGACMHMCSLQGNYKPYLHGESQ